ncbi:MAG: dTMP kinase [Actinomycetota bacterium]
MASYAEEIAALRGTRAATYKELLGHRPFRRLLAAQSVSSLGDWIGFSAVAILAIRLGGTAAPYAVAGVMVSRMLPGIFLGAIAGALTDRVDRRRLMIAADLGRGALYAVLPFVPRLWAMYLLSFAIETLSLFWTPARDASLPNLVPKRQLGNANSMGLLSTYGTLPIGGAVFALTSGIAVALSGRIPYLGENPESLGLWLDAATFLFSATMLSRIPFPPPPADHGKVPLRFARVWEDILVGLRFLRESSLASAMTLGIVIAFSAVGAVLAVGPIFVRQTLGAGAAGWGVLQTTVGLGLASGMILGARATRGEREQLFVAALLLAAVAEFVFAATSSLTPAAVMSIVLGLFCGATWVNGYVLLQENVEDEFRGRTFAALTVLSRLGLFLSLTTFPVIVGIVGADHGIDVATLRFDLSGTRVAMWLAGAMVVGAAVLSRRGLSRHRISRPLPLALVPRLRRPPADGLFVAFEGVEGSGKGSQIERAAAYLRGQGLDVVTTREPGGTPLGESLRELLLDTSTGHVQPRAEALLFAAARTQLASHVIRPALAAGKIVLCDRYVDSSIAYQGWARGVGEQDVLTLNAWATQGLFPDLVLLLHLEPQTGLARASAASGPDRMEREGVDFHTKVADAYLRIAEEHPERFVVIDVTDLDADAVQDKVVDAIARTLAQREADERDG